jgi:hypothetical protein
MEETALVAVLMAESSTLPSPFTHADVYTKLVGEPKLLSGKE